MTMVTTLAMGWADTKFEHACKQYRNVNVNVTKCNDTKVPTKLNRLKLYRAVEYLFGWKL